MNDEKNNKQTAEELASVMQKAAIQLQSIGRTDLILHALGVPLLEELRIEAARGRWSSRATTDFCCRATATAK